VFRQDEQVYDKLLTIQVLEDLAAKLRNELPNDVYVHVSICLIVCILQRRKVNV